MTEAFYELAERLMKKGPKKASTSKDVLKMSVEGHQHAPPKKCCG